MVRTYLKTFGRMFRRHFTRLISIILMVLVSVGFTAGIGMSTDKINDSLAEYRDAQNVSDLILLNDDGTFTDDDVTALRAQFGEQNVQTGGMLEFEVKDGKATVNDTELTFTNVPDGIVRVYLFDEASAPSEVTQNLFEDVVTYDTSAAGDDAIVVYAERATEQLEGYDEAQTFTLSFSMHDSSTRTESIPFLGEQKIAIETDISVTQNYVLGGTVRNPLHMAVRDDPSYTDDPASDDEEDMLDLTTIFYVFGDLIDTKAATDTTVSFVDPALQDFNASLNEEYGGAGETDLTVSAADMRNQINIRLTDAGTLFGFGYDDALDDAEAAIASLGLSAEPQVLTLHENYSFESFTEYGGKIAGIGYVLMVVFLLVTILVVLSTMTRLLDEERGQIACLMTLGYSPASIIVKYLLFALVGTLIGGVGAYFAGLGLARIIYVNFEWNYTLPPYSSNVVMTFYLITFAVILVSTLVATAVAGHKLTREQPANLLRPKTPKAGKTIFLERIPFIWKRLSFKYKSTMRNVLRFFVRFLMTVVSVAFSTALVLAGLAVLDCCLFQDIGGAAMIAVALIVLIFAALLNFVVIYTLTNINISERERELATLMVLGYYDGEVAGYIYREIYITSIIGILFGLPLGCLLCLFIFNVMGFGSIPGISWFVWVLAPILSVVFTLLVTLMLRRKITKIDMNNSLKAIE